MAQRATWTTAAVGTELLLRGKAGHDRSSGAPDSHQSSLPAQLYEATRGVWKVGSRCTKARYAFAIFEGVVREVYEIESWHAAATTPYVTRDASQLTTNGRREFIGRIADAAIRDVYAGGSVAEQFRQGLQSPILYINC